VARTSVGGEAVTITLHIDRLVLDGAAFARMDRARLGAAVQEQLAALLRDEMNIDALSAHHGAATIRGEGAAAAGGRGRRERTAAHVPAEATAAQWGHHIAGAVHGAITRDGRGDSRSTGPREQRGGARDGGERDARGGTS
jgi:hypothetical protein